jgi:hypothetical protein
MKTFRRPWTQLIALTGLLPALFFRETNHPAFQIIKVFSVPLACLTLGSLIWSLRPQGWPQFPPPRDRLSPPVEVNWRFPLALLLATMVLFSGIRSSLISSDPRDPRIHYLLTGDEPSYLLITHSLVFDGDLDLSNNREDTRYFSRHPLLGSDQFGFNFYNRIAQGRLTGKEKGWGERQYFINRPGLPLLIAPAYWVGFQADKRIRFSVLVWMNLIAAFFILILFFLAKTHYGSVPAGIAAFYFALTPPIIFYSNQIYPEVPAALCLAGALLGLIKAEKKWELLFTGLAVAGLPWFHERFIGLFLVLMAAAFFRPNFRRHWPIFLMLPLLSLIFQGMYYHSFYGVPFPLNSHKPLSLSAVPRGLLAMLTDRDRGLLFLNASMVLSFLGVIPLWRRDRWLTLTLLMLLLSYLVPVASFPDWHGGVCPPLRYWVIVVPLSLIPAVALFTREDRSFTKAGMIVLGAWSIWMGAVSAVQPKLWFWQYGPLFAPPAFQPAHVFFPGYFHPKAHSKIVSLCWLSLVLSFPLLDWLRRFKQKADPLRPVYPWVPLILTVGVLLISVGSWLITAQIP